MPSLLANIRQESHTFVQCQDTLISYCRLENVDGVLVLPHRSRLGSLLSETSISVTRTTFSVSRGYMSAYSLQS